MKVKILNKIWNIVFVPKSQTAKNGLTRNDLGSCDEPSAKGKKITILEGLDPKTELYVTIHECLHASDWFKDEEWIICASEDISRLLWKLGWRKQTEPDQN